MVDWALARRIAGLAAGQATEEEPPFDAAVLSVEMEGPVASYTGLALASPTPPAEVVRRAQWAAVNLDTLSHILDPVAARLDDRLGFAGPLAGALRAGAAATLAAEAGLVMGYLSSRVLGRYDATLEVRIESGSAGGLPSLPDPARLVEAFREGGLAALVQSPEQRALMDEVQAAMSVIEGYSEHVMDAIAAEVIPGHEELRQAMDRRRRSRSAPQRIIERLLGFDVKLRQYELGKKFADAVVALGGMEALNRVWASPEALPSSDELQHPESWLKRTEPAPSPA